MMATPSICLSSSFREYSTLSPVLVLILPVHLLDLSIYFRLHQGCAVCNFSFLRQPVPVFRYRMLYVCSRSRSWSSIWRSKFASSCQWLPFGFHLFEYHPILSNQKRRKYQVQISDVRHRTFGNKIKLALMTKWLKTAKPACYIKLPQKNND